MRSSNVDLYKLVITNRTRCCRVNVSLLRYSRMCIFYHYFYGYRVFTIDGPPRPRRSGWVCIPVPSHTPPSKAGSLRNDGRVHIGK